MAVPPPRPGRCAVTGRAGGHGRAVPRTGLAAVGGGTRARGTRLRHGAWTRRVRTRRAGAGPAGAVREGARRRPGPAPAGRGAIPDPGARTPRVRTVREGRAA